MEAMATMIAANAPTNICCICGKDLTDMASVEAGIGPICRARTNHALAISFDADHLEAWKTLEKVVITNIPEVARLAFAKAKIAIEGSEFDKEFDGRKAVRQLCYVASFVRGEHTVSFDTIVQTIEHLGYVAVATLLRGEASFGKVTLTVGKGHLVLSAPRNRAGWVALSKMGAWFDRPTSTIRFSTKIAEKVLSVVRTYWFGLEAVDVAALVEQANAASETVSAATPAPATPAVVTLTEEDGFLWLVSPYSVPFVTELKLMPWGDRAFIVNRWRIHMSHRAYVTTLVQKHFGVTL